MNELIATFLILMAGGVFLFSRKAGAVSPVTGGGFDLPNITVSEFNHADLDTLARTIWGEARGEGYTGMQAVANVVMNRYEQAKRSQIKARQFGTRVIEICVKEYQFSVWNSNDPNLPLVNNVDESDALFRQALEIAQAALDRRLPDITGGANHYHTVSISASWSRGKQPVARIGNHVFYDL